MNEAKVLKIHDCSELPQLSDLTLDTTCLEQIHAHFALPKWRGSGQYGFTLQLAGSKEEDLIVKVSEINEQELRIACQLNALIDDTPIFPHAHGWLVCHTIPHRWTVALNAHLCNHEFLLAPPEKFMFTFIQPVEARWDEISLVLDHGYRVALFFLLHGLYVAGKKVGFRHGDIHSDNVMLQRNMSHRSTANTTQLRFGQFETDVSSEFVPRLIDYGRSRTTNHGGGSSGGSNDLRQLRILFDQTLDKDGSSAEMEAERAAFYHFVASVKWDELTYRYEREAESVILSLLIHEYFKVPEIQTRAVKKQAVEPIQWCFSCCSPDPFWQVDLETPKYFCGKRCYEKVRGIGRFIK